MLIESRKCCHDLQIYGICVIASFNGLRNIRLTFNIFESLSISVWEEKTHFSVYIDKSSYAVLSSMYFFEQLHKRYVHILLNDWYWIICKSCKRKILQNHMLLLEHIVNSIIVAFTVRHKSWFSLRDIKKVNKIIVPYTLIL